MTPPHAARRPHADRRAHAKRGVSERAFADQVEDLFRLFSWSYYHTWRSDHSPAGFPDYCAIRPPQMVFLELKGSRGQPSAEQQEWLEGLLAVGAAAYCVWPDQLEWLAEVLT